MQFINTFEGVKTRCVCKPDQTLFSATTNKNGKKRSGHARLGILLEISDLANLCLLETNKWCCKQLGFLPIYIQYFTFQNLPH